MTFGLAESLSSLRDVYASRRTEHRLDRLDRMTSPAYGLGEPLFFHHIAKTGGTSLTAALRSVIPADLIFSEHGNLSAGFTQRLVARGLRQGQLIHGHPATGAALPLRGRSRIVTLLREPRDQVISNYFHVRTHRSLPDHAAARQLGFREFLLTHNYYAIFQTASLHVGIQEAPIARTEDIIDRLPQIFEYVEEMYMVGAPDLAEYMFDRLTSSMDPIRRARFPHHRKTRLTAAQRALLHEQFDELQSHPSLASLFAAERATFEKARSRFMTEEATVALARSAEELPQSHRLILPQV